MTTIKRRASKLIPLPEAGKMVAKYKTIAMVDGTAPPMAIIREAIKAGASDLTLIPTMIQGTGCDLFIAAGCAKLVYLSFAGFDTSPAFHKGVKAGTMNYIEGDEVFAMLGAKAAAYNLPFIPVQRFIYGAIDVPKLNPLIRLIKDPYTGEEVYAIPPLKADICIFHVPVADEFGNVQGKGGGKHEPDKAKSADIVVVSAEQIVPNDVIRQNPEKTIIPGHLVDAVVYAPFGAHPQGLGGHYSADSEHLKSYREMVRADKEKEYLSKFVFEPKDYYEYLELIGIRKLMELKQTA